MIQVVESQELPEVKTLMFHRRKISYFNFSILLIDIHTIILYAYVHIYTNKEGAMT